MKTSQRRRRSRGAPSIPCLPAFLAVAVLTCGAGRLSAAGDAARGRDVLREQQCISCHPIEPDGTGVAPNLYRVASRGLNPASFTALLWNHAPRMWSAMEARGLAVPQPSEQEVADLFAYFYSLRYFEPPGDAGRGKQVFERKKCVQCHPLDSSGTPAPGAKPVSEWVSITDPVVRLEAFWNHAAGMSAEMKRRGIRWPHFTPQEMADVWVFLRNRPSTMAGTARGSFGDAAKGETLFESQACGQCHTVGESVRGKVDLAQIPDEDRNLAAFGAAMWNHQQWLAGDAEPLAEGDMADLIAYLQSEELFWPSGDAQKGAKVFREGRCAGCHEDASSGAPRLSGSSEPYTPARIASALWRHGPKMLERMKQQGISWRQFSGSQLSDLIAYVNTR